MNYIRDIYSKVCSAFPEKDVNDLSLIFPPMISIILFAQYLRSGNDEFMAIVWIYSIFFSCFVCGFIRYRKNTKGAAVLTSAIIGLAVGFAAGQGPATIFAASGTADVSFHISPAYLGMVGYVMPVVFQMLYSYLSHTIKK